MRLRVVEETDVELVQDELFSEDEKYFMNIFNYYNENYKEFLNGKLSFVNKYAINGQISDRTRVELETHNKLYGITIVALFRDRKFEAVWFERNGIRTSCAFVEKKNKMLAKDWINELLNSHIEFTDKFAQKLY